MVSVSAIQMNSGPDVAANLQVAGDLLRAAADAGAALAVLPENFGFIGRRESDRVALAEEDGSGPMQSFLAASARELGIWIVGGSVPIRSEDDDGRYRAACVVYDSDGDRQARYDKIHLFDVAVPASGKRYSESRNISPGARPCFVNTPWGKLGLAICYDLRFPELFRLLVERGADFFAVPSAFTFETGQAHWTLLLRARAVENQSLVIGANQCGQHVPGRHSYGHSVVFGPWGHTLAEAGDEPAVITAQWDPIAQASLREDFAALPARRFGVDEGAQSHRTLAERE